MRVGLLNLKVGNINSVHNVLKKIGISVEIIDTETQYKNQDLIILSGVSSFDNQIKQLKDKNFFELLKNENKKKVIGICSGMQIMFNSSSEGNELGLNIFNENLVKFSNKPNTHIGWNKVFSNESYINGKEYYFCHSYFAPINNYMVAKSFYGEYFSCIVKKDNFYGIQFHPEKSGKDGLYLLKHIINH